MEITRPAIVITIFGSSSTEGQKNLEDIDTMVRERYPGYEVRWALTSEFIIKKLRESGRGTMFERKVAVQSLAEAYDGLRRDGFTKASVQSLLVITGSEYNDTITTPAVGLEIEYGFPLLAPPDNVERVVRALEPKFGDNETATILCSHGNAKNPGYNVQLLLMEKYVRKHHRGVFLVTLEGPPGTETAFTEIKRAGYKKVKFIPLLIVSGEHITRDIIGDGPKTYKSILSLPWQIEGSLSGNPEIMSIWMESIDWTLTKLK
jgi:sirohydrochlorin cobaltochelatase